MKASLSYQPKAVTLILDFWSWTPRILDPIASTSCMSKCIRVRRRRWRIVRRVGWGMVDLSHVLSRGSCSPRVGIEDHRESFRACSRMPLSDFPRFSYVPLYIGSRTLKTVGFAKPQWRKFKLNINMTFSRCYTCRGVLYKTRPRIVNYVEKNNCSCIYMFQGKANKSGYDD